MAKSLNVDRLYTAIASIMEAKYNIWLSLSVKNPDGTVVGRYGSLANVGNKK